MRLFYFSETIRINFILSKFPVINVSSAKKRWSSMPWYYLHYKVYPTISTIYNCAKSRAFFLSKKNLSLFTHRKFTCICLFIDITYTNGTTDTAFKKSNFSPWKKAPQLWRQKQYKRSSFCRTWTKQDVFFPSNKLV